MSDPGTSLTSSDHFGTQNRFYGGQIGCAGGVRHGRPVRGRYGQGRPWRHGGIGQHRGGLRRFDGLSRACAVVHAPGGFFAQPGTNIGHYSQDRFAVVPEMGVNVGYDITCWARVFVGYTFMYISDVARPGNQINPTVNPSQLLAFAPFGAPRQPPGRSSPAVVRLPQFGLLGSDHQRRPALPLLSDRGSPQPTTAWRRQAVVFFCWLLRAQANDASSAR